MYYGYDEYVKSTKKIIETTRYIERKLREMDGIFVFATTQIHRGNHNVRLLTLDPLIVIINCSLQIDR